MHCRALGADLINQWRRGDPLCMPCAFEAAGMSIGYDLLNLGLSRIPGVKQLVRAVGKRMYAAGKPIRDWAKRGLSNVLDILRRTEVYTEGLGSMDGNIRIRGRPGRVSKPGGLADKYKSYKTDAAVPARYRDDPRFNSLAIDPDHAGKVSLLSRAEAMAGLEAESQGLIKGPIQRGPKGIEFYDVDGRPWDVKAPPSPKPGDPWPFKPEQPGKAILDELSKKASPPGAPAGTFPQGTTGLPEPRRVILDSTYMNETDHKALWNWLNNNLKPDELNRIVEVNTRL